MDTYEDGQKRIKAKAAEQELVPVHAPSNRSLLPRYHPNFPPSLMLLTHAAFTYTLFK